MQLALTSNREFFLLTWRNLRVQSGSGSMFKLVKDHVLDLYAWLVPFNSKYKHAKPRNIIDLKADVSRHLF